MSKMTNIKQLKTFLHNPASKGSIKFDITKEYQAICINRKTFLIDAEFPIYAIGINEAKEKAIKEKKIRNLLDHTVKVKYKNP